MCWVRSASRAPRGPGSERLPTRSRTPTPRPVLAWRRPAPGRIKLPAGAKLNYSEIAADLGYLLSDVLQIERTRAEKSEQPVSRKRLKLAAWSVDTALTGGPPERGAGLVAAAAGTPHKKLLDELNAKVQDLLKKCDTDIDIATVAAAHSELEKLLPARTTNKQPEKATAGKGPADTAEKTTAARA